MNVNQYPVLPPDAKKSARIKAKQRTVDDLRPPLTEQDIQVNSQWTDSVRRGLLIAMVLMFIVGFVPSAMRVFTVAKTNFGIVQNVFGTSLNTSVIGAATLVLMAEIAVVLFVVSARLVMQEWQRRLYYLMALLSAAFAILGNIQATLTYENTKGFAWLISLMHAFTQRPFVGLETILPPIFTLVGGILFGEIAMEDARIRREKLQVVAEREHDRQVILQTVETEPKFLEHYQEAIWEAYKLEYSRKRFWAETEWSVQLMQQIIAREIASSLVMSLSEIEAIAKRIAGEEIEQVINFSQGPGQKSLTNSEESGIPLDQPGLDQNPVNGSVKS